MNYEVTRYDFIISRVSGVGGPKYYQKDCDCLSLLSIDVDNAPPGYLIEGTGSNGIWQVMISGSGLPVGRHEMYLHAHSSDGTAIPYDEWPEFSFDVLSDPSATESVGPRLTLLSVSPSYVETVFDEITVRWRVSDASGIPNINNQGVRPARYASRFRSVCSRSDHNGISRLYSGAVSGEFFGDEQLVTDATFEATLRWGRSAPVYGSSCSLEFLTYDKWGNWTRNTFVDQYTTALSMR
jgi:hypothetical protein